MKIVAFGSWYYGLEKIISQEDVVLLGEMHVLESMGDDVDLVCLDANHTNCQIIGSLAQKGVNVICKGLWCIENYLSLIKEFNKHGKFILEDESFLFYEKVITFIDMATKLLQTDCIPNIDIKANCNNVYAAIKIISIICPDIRQLSIEQYIKTPQKDFFWCKNGKRKIGLEIDKTVFYGLGQEYSSKSINIEIQTIKGNLSIRGYAGPILWEAPYPEIDKGISEDAKGYFFHPITQIINSDKCYDIHANKEYKHALTQEAKRVLDHVKSKSNGLGKMQQQSFAMKNCNTIIGELSNTENSENEYFPMMLEEMKKEKREYASPEEIFQDITPDYLEYSVKRRNEVMAQTMLAYLNDKGVLQKGIPCTVKQILSRLNAEESCRIIILRWIKLLLKQKYITAVGTEEYVSLTAFSKTQLEAGWKEIEYLWCGKLESPLVLQYLLNNIKNWDKLIQKEQNATLLLFEQGEDSYADALYKDTKILLYANQLLSGIVMRYIESHKSEVVILEIGAGTGATSDIVLRDISINGYNEKVTYYYSDISKYFLQKAKERYGCYDNKIDIRYQTLDIDRNFTSQLSDEIEVDIVIAVGVLNNSVNTDICIQQINSIMKQGGILLITETIEDVPDMLISQAFMMSIPNDRRKDRNTTFLDRNQWLNILQECGFSIIAEYPDAGSYLEIMGQKLFYVTKERL